MHGITIKYSCEGMVSVQKVEDKVHWGTSLISILLSLLFNYNGVTLESLLLWSNWTYSDNDVP